MEITEESFRKAVEQKQNKKGISFVLTVYQTLDESVAQEAQDGGIKIACKKGCSLCCNQLYRNRIR